MSATSAQSAPTVPTAAATNVATTPSSTTTSVVTTADDATTAAAAPTTVAAPARPIGGGAGGRGGGLERVLAKLQRSVADGNFYEAHQMYRTLYFRYLNQQKFEDCLQLLHQGARNFCECGQHSIGADLGCLVVDTLAKRGRPKSEEELEKWLGNLGELIGMIEKSVVERETLLVKSVKWSSEVSVHKLGHPLIHKLIAQHLWSEANASQARYHYLLSRDGAGFGRMLVQLAQSRGCAAAELDLFVAQVVLQQLSLKEKATAALTFATYARQHPLVARSEPPFAQPLLNFVFYLLKCCDSPATLPVFRALCEAYKTALARDASYEKYLQKIGVIYFGAPAVQPLGGGGGLFGDLITQMFAGLGDDDEEEGGEGGEGGADDGDDDDDFDDAEGEAPLDLD